MSTKVTDALLEKMGVSRETLFETARENMRKNNPVHIVSMEVVMAKMMSGESLFDQSTNILDEIAEFPDVDHLAIGMFTMGCESQINGAASVFLPEVMDALSDKFPEGYYILPSSIHEVLIVPKSETSPGLTELNDMVHTVNEEQVAPQERLSEFVHEYDPKAKAVYIAGGEKPSLDMAAKEEVMEGKKEKPSGR